MVPHALLGTELENVVRAIQVKPWILPFFPYSFAGLWYIVCQSNGYSAYFFNVRISFLPNRERSLDRAFLSRTRTRARMGSGNCFHGQPIALSV